MKFKVKINYNIVSTIEEKFKKQGIPNIEIGDSLKIGLLTQEGNKERIQTLEGVVICKKNHNLSSTITVRKILHNIGVERIYPIHSPRITKIEITRKSKVRRAKLYYLRNRSGKGTRLKQNFSSH